MSLALDRPPGDVPVDPTVVAAPGVGSSDAVADVDVFKEAFRRYPSGVALVTTVHDDEPVGLTVSSLASVAADPPALSFSVSGGRSAEGVAAASHVTVHVLPESRADLASAFATSGAPRFTAEQGWQRDGDGAWLLPDALATLSGPVVGTVPVGSSRLLVVEVADVALGPRAAPLVHHDRTYRHLT